MRHDGVLASDEMKQAFAKMGALARPSAPDELAAYLAHEQNRWARVVEMTRISIE
jgi:tripartite-type tricarboxylate transporter receptor subunit TctC